MEALPLLRFPFVRSEALRDHLFVDVHVEKLHWRCITSRRLQG